jgi:hypothetical protein
MILSEKEKIYLQLIAVPTGEGDGFVLLMQDRSNQQKIFIIQLFLSNRPHKVNILTENRTHSGNS